MELAVYNTSGKETSKKVNLDSDVFGIEPNDHAIYLDVKQYLAQQRQGTHKAKERAEIAGSTKKIKKQKGTGTARFGNIKNPLFKGGGRVFGPRPRNYGFKLNKKVKRLARKSALSYKAKESNITILDGLKLDAPKTKDFMNVLNNLKINDAKTLVVLGNYDNNVYLSSRNVAKSTVTTAAELNTYDILNANKIVISEDALEVINNTLK
ncbi:50S ribosomal protein L4 [Parvicella tangerina]|uniref:Large ribosomal subunit protein uL4 n=1 Tax=Parvicella tangerina TaxID=2829795 RepID=A0A916JM84_9FLAO|nr:50S ribosomal protein L4 [Parvicella tangerina]CAG5079082.1 50S ribosomal protein L4 [Parvicella tangerina]